MTSPLALTQAELVPRGPAGAFLLTDEQAAALGAGKKAFPVSVLVNGHTLSLRLARMGGENLIGLAKAARAQAGVEIGACYDVLIGLDATERQVEVPTDLAEALRVAGPTVESAFTALAYSHRKEYVRWITEAKREATRAERVTKTIERVRGDG